MTGDPILSAMTTAVAEASHVCRELRRRDDDPARMTKSDDSPVTVADFAAQAVALQRLSNALESPWVVAEENTDALRQHAALRQKVVEAARIVWTDATEDDVLGAIDLGRTEPPAEGPWWALDPIDGTKGFVRGGQFAVCLGRIAAGRPDYAAMGCPHLSTDPSVPATDVDLRGALYVTDGKTATVQAIEAGASAVPVTPIETARDPAILVRSYESGHSNIGDLHAVMQRADLPFEEVAVDSQVKYALVAVGRADVYLRKPRDGRKDAVWDHAAGVSLVTSLGRIATDIQGKALDWTAGSTLANNTGILCAPPAIHDRLVRAVEA
jgi:3'(2'), 5'-bisphosphate nucleotidase